MSDDPTRTPPPDNSPTHSADVPPDGTLSDGLPPGSHGSLLAAFEQFRHAVDDFAVASHPPPDVPGFEVLEELGRGGMGVVYKARQVRLNRVVALKMVLAGPHAGHAGRIRFLAEAEAVAAIKHPHVVQVHEFGEAGGHPFLAMEFLDGGNLGAWLKTSGPLDPRDSAVLVAKIADGVAAAHDLGIVHRDLKPDNVLLSADRTPKVTDFGLAKRGAGGDLTHTGALMGTPHYMSPEQAGGRAKFVGPAARV